MLGYTCILARAKEQKVKMQDKKFAALFVDCENLYYSIKNNYENVDYLFSEILLNLVKEMGTEFSSEVLIRRAYAPFSSAHFLGNIDELALQGFVPVHVLSDARKNSVDMMLAVEVIEVLYKKPEIEVFCIVGGDRDYIPIVGKLKELGKTVYVCALETSMSGDLLRFVGEDFFLDPLWMVERDEIVPLEVKNESQGKESSESYDASSVSYSEINTVLDEAKLFREKHNNEELWLSPFMGALRKRFPDKSAEKIRGIIHGIEDMGVWKIEERDSYRDGISSYSVLLVEWEHSLFFQKLGDKKDDQNE